MIKIVVVVIIIIIIIIIIRYTDYMTSPLALNIQYNIGTIDQYAHTHTHTYIYIYIYIYIYGVIGRRKVITKILNVCHLLR